MLTLGAGENGEWRTLCTVEVATGPEAGRAGHTFIATPDPVQKPGQISASAEIDRFQPAEFKVTFNGEVITTLKGDDNTDLSPASGSLPSPPTAKSGPPEFWKDVTHIQPRTT